MTEDRPAIAALAGLVAVSAVACAPPVPPVGPAPTVIAPDVRALPSRPPVAFVAREGDPRGAVAVAVRTAGVADEEGPKVPVALAAVVEARLLGRGVESVTVAPTWDGYRVRALLPASGDSASIVQAIHDALLTPIADNGPEAVAVTRKLAALAQRPLTDPALLDAARCAEAPMALDHGPSNVNAASLERWRAGSQGQGRIVFGAVGPTRVVEGVTSALLAGAAWPPGSDVVAPAVVPPSAAVRVYDAAEGVAPGSARVTLVVHTASPDVAVAAANALGQPDAPLAFRLHGLDTPVTLRSVAATAQANGGCLAIALDVLHEPARAAVIAEGALPSAVAIARQETHEAVLAASHHERPVRPAVLAADPREAAELAAWWALVPGGSSTAPAERGESVAVGLGPVPEAPDDFAARARALTAALERVEGSWQTRVVEGRGRVEAGQGELLVLLASPCGTLSEGAADAGLTALALAALAEQVRDEPGAVVSEWVTAEGAGLIVRTARQPGEAATALAQRAGDTVGKALLAGAVDPAAIARARAGLMATTTTSDARAFAALALAVTPGHPSWTLPVGSGQGLEAWSDGAVTSRIQALRRGPLRAAVLGTESDAEVTATIDALDRWAARPPGAGRTCSATATPEPPKPGTYAAPASALSSVWLALPIAKGDRDAARLVAAALDGPNGLLAHALSTGLAFGWGARIVGPVDAPALAVHVVSTSGNLDAAVAQVRALLDRVRQGALTEEDRTRAVNQLTQEELTSTLAPVGRLVRLWRGDPPFTEPTLDALRTFVAKTLRDDAWILVASRPSPPKVTP